MGECTRYVKIDEARELRYFATGKVFQWVNFVTASTKNYPQEGDDQKNVVFHIMGQTCRPMSNLSRDDRSVADEGQSVLFGMGTEFLCCKTDQRGNQLHVYLREIRTGFGTNNVLWVDDELFQQPGGMPNQNQAFLHYIYHMCFQKNVNFILKPSSKLAWDYLDSDFFPRSLDVCSSFKVVSDVTRFNEPGTQEDQWNAGPRFIRKFLDKTANTQGIEKVQTMVFCGDKQSARRKF